MLAPTAVIRANSRIALKKHFIHYIAASAALLFSAVFIFLLAEILSEVVGSAFAEIIFIMLAAFLIFPLFLGVVRFFWQAQLDSGITVSEVFFCFSSISAYRKAIETAVRLAGRALICLIPCFAPAVIVQALCSPSFYELLGVAFPDFAANLWFTHGCLSAIGLLVFIFTQLKYYLVPFLCVADENMSAAEAINFSKIISKRTRSDYISLIFSFAGWILLSFTGIPLLFTVPYFIMAYIVHSRFAIAQYNAAVQLNNRSCCAVGC